MDETKETKTAPDAAPVKAAGANAGPEATGEGKKLTNKEIKELKKKEKAAKRAAQKEASGITIEQQEKIAQKKMEIKKEQSTATNTNLKKQLNQTVIKDKEAKKIPRLFSHLESREQRNASSPTISHIVHPAILSLSLKYSSFKIVGSTPRLKKMLEVFKTVIQDYVTPENTTLTRHLTGHLSHQIEYLKSARPLSISMGNAIRWLKQEISHISIDTPEQEAKEILYEKIDNFIEYKITVAHRAMLGHASQDITDGSIILTYGHSEFLETLFKYCAVEQGKHFKLIVVDSKPLFEGKTLLHNLANTYADDANEALHTQKNPITKERIKISYVLMNSLSSSMLEDVDCVFLGANAMLSNGRLFSRVGTSFIAMMCHTRNIPVITCCESVKFSDKVQLDSVTNNELADGDDIIQNDTAMKPPQKKCFSLEQFLKEFDSKTKEQVKPKQLQQQKKKGEEPAEEKNENGLEDWKNIPNVNILNIMYDLCPPEYIKKVVTEFGVLPPSSVPVILREYKNVF